MRKPVLYVLAFTFIFCSVVSGALGEETTASGEETSTSRPWYIHPTIGFNSPSLGDVNDYLDSTEQIFESGLGSSVSWDNFGMAAVFGFELGKQVSNSAFLGVKFAYQKSSISNSYQNSTAAISFDPAYSLYDFSARLKFVLPSAPGLYLGASAGYASGKFTEELDFNYFPDPNENLQAESEYTGSGLALGGFVGYQLSIGKTVFLTGELGYKLRNLGSFEGTITSPQLGTFEGTAVDNSGKEMDFDFSGVSVDIGVVFLLGG